jgi:Rrf2 family protein
MFNLTAEYALRAVVYLATHQDKVISRDVMAGEIQVPGDYLHKTLQELGRAGVVKIQRGPGGGYRLAASAEEITVWDVVTIFQGFARIERCPLGIEGHEQLCPLHRKMDEAVRATEEVLKSVSIAQLLPQARASKNCSFPKPRP